VKSSDSMSWVSLDATGEVEPSLLTWTSSKSAIPTENPFSGLLKVTVKLLGEDVSEAEFAGEVDAIASGLVGVERSNWLVPPKNPVSIDEPDITVRASNRSKDG
jgi:hypothetical protein